MRILIMGAGSLGSVVGGFLAKAGHDVTLIGRADHMDAIRQRGLQIKGIWGDHIATNLETHTSVSELGEGYFDLILITVKSYDTKDAVAAVAPLVGDDTLVCSYQNGLGNAEVIAEAVGWERTVGARAIFGARMPEEGTVEVTVIANPTALGVYRDSTPKDRVREIAEAMDAAGVPTEYTDQIETVLWSKVAYNCALNPLSAILDVPYGGLLETDHTRAIMTEAIHELYAVGAAVGVTLEPATADEYVHLLFDVLIPPTAGHYASMREDFRRKRRTEIDALNGAIARYGREHDVPTAVNATLTRVIHGIEHTYGVD